MCLEIGNKVAVLDDVIKGVVTFISGRNVKIKDEEGMEFLFDVSDLVKIGTEQDQIKTKIDERKILNSISNQDKGKKKSLFKKVNNEVIMEVDLHIDKLIKSKRGMDNYDILSLQIDTAKRKIEYCIHKRISKIIFIHGVGEGVLKTELRYLLNRYPVKYYDASYQKYGLGATEVYVYQNV